MKIRYNPISFSFNVSEYNSSRSLWFNEIIEKMRKIELKRKYKKGKISKNEYFLESL